MRLIVIPLCLSLAACAIAFGAGTHRAPVPKRFSDLEHAEQQKKEIGVPPPTLIPGVTVVVGGERIDAGVLPPPPIPIAAPF